MQISSYELSRKSKKWWHRFFFGLIDRALCNAFITFNKITKAKMKSLYFRRRLAQSLITHGRPLKVGRPLSYAPPTASKKRKSLTYSVPQSIRKENLEVHWPNYYQKRGRCEVCARTSKKLAPISNVVHVMCSFVWMKRKIVSQSSMNCKWALASAFYVAIVTYFVNIYKEK